MKNSIGQKVKKIRELRNYTQEYMSIQLDMSQNGYSKIERDEVDLSVSKLNKIADILKVNVLDLLTFDENRQFFNITQNETGNGVAIYNQSNVEKELYERIITELKSEVELLKDIIKTLTK